MNALEMALEALENPSVIAVQHAIALLKEELAKPKAWVGLTDEERHAYTQSPFTEENYRAIEARLKEKNK